MPDISAKRKRNVDPVVAAERARKGGLARSRPDILIVHLERAELNAQQKLRLALLVLSFSVSGTGGDDHREGTPAGAL